jgi:metallo-beta-lactamase class B
VGKFLLVAVAAISCFAAFNPQWNESYPPHRVIGNVYYVGTNYLASYLITTNEGHILINPDFEESVPIIDANIAKLGFHFKDIKIIVISHAHDDHCAGAALVKKLTGARLMVMDADVQEVQDGGASDFHYTNMKWKPVKVDQVLHDGDQVRLGAAELTAHKTAGHTKGCTTWTMQVAGRDVVIVGSPNVNEGYKLVDNAKYPDIAEDYKQTFKVLKSLRCDVFLGAHGAYYGLDAKFRRLAAGGSNPFIDPRGYEDWVAERELAFRQELTRQGGR